MDFNIKWAQEYYDEFLKELLSNADEKYREFNLKLIPGETEAIGIRLPAIRKTAKEIAKYDPTGFIAVSGSRYTEEVMIRSLVIAGIKDTDMLIAEVRSFIPFIRNWSICDTFCSSLKQARKNPTPFLELIKECLESDEEYTVRFAVVMLMDYFIDDEHIDYILDVCRKIKSGKYYINMAVAWCISVCFVKYPDKTVLILKDNSLDKFTHNKSIQKIRESFRVDDDTKNALKLLKK